jgi:hypothetical protein
LVCPTDAPVGVAGETVLQSHRQLPDGVYCLHTGEFSDQSEVPDFAAPFVLRGWGQPEIVGQPAVQITQNGQRGQLTLTILNQGKGQFNDGLLVVTLQKAKGQYGEFKGRKNVSLQAIPPGSTKAFSVEMELRGLEAEQYYFYGHVNYIHLFDANALCEFESPRFSLPPPSTSTTAPDPKSP